MMTIAEMSQRLGIPATRIRYVIDRGVVPLDDVGRGRGMARELDDLETITVGIAAVLIERGVRKPMVIGLLAGVVTNATPEALRMLTSAPKKDEVLLLDFADRASRLRKGTRETVAWNSHIAGDRLGAGYSPITWVTLDMTELRRRLYE